ncbi:MAG: hypothetical protein WC547_07150, partial [Candidatus Omnitrophota bacterium]
FTNFSCTALGKVLRFQALSTQTIVNNITIVGAAGGVISLIRNGGAGPAGVAGSDQWFIDPQNALGRNVDWLNVQDSNNISGVVMFVNVGFDLGNNFDWFFNVPPPAGPDSNWRGVVSNDWNTPWNWDNNTVPGSASDVTISLKAIEPALTADTECGNMAIYTGATLTTNGFAVIVNGDLVINGTLAGAASSISAAGSVTTSAGGRITGDEVSLNSSGVVGTWGNPVAIETTSPIVIQAAGIRENTSVSINTNTGIELQGPIAGFVFINGELAQHLGQAQIRSQLATQSANLYRRVSAYFTPSLLGGPDAASSGSYLLYWDPRSFLEQHADR